MMMQHDVHKKREQQANQEFYMQDANGAPAYYVDESYGEAPLLAQPHPAGLASIAPIPLAASIQPLDHHYASRPLAPPVSGYPVEHGGEIPRGVKPALPLGDAVHLAHDVDYRGEVSEPRLMYMQSPQYQQQPVMVPLQRGPVQMAGVRHQQVTIPYHQPQSQHAPAYAPAQPQSLLIAPNRQPIRMPEPQEDVYGDSGLSSMMDDMRINPVCFYLGDLHRSTLSFLA
jgi:hypothetical protein